MIAYNRAVHKSAQGATVIKDAVGDSRPTAQMAVTSVRARVEYLVWHGAEWKLSTSYP